MINIFDRQPDYDTWPSDPDNDIFERKAAILERIENDWDVLGTIANNDFFYLLHKATNFWQLFHFASTYRLEMETELMSKDLEIEDLKKQLEKAQYGE